jgi:ribosomal protein S27AE
MEARQRKGNIVLAYRTVTQDTCPHDAKVKMAGFKDRYECTRCQKIIPYVPSNEKNNDDKE